MDWENENWKHVIFSKEFLIVRNFDAANVPRYIPIPSTKMLPSDSNFRLDLLNMFACRAPEAAVRFVLEVLIFRLLSLVMRIIREQTRS
jgi:hypothetical protein